MLTMGGWGLGWMGGDMREKIYFSVENIGFLLKAN